MAGMVSCLTPAESLVAVPSQYFQIWFEKSKSGLVAVYRWLCVCFQHFVVWEASGNFPGLTCLSMRGLVIAENVHCAVIRLVCSAYSTGAVD